MKKMTAVEWLYEQLDDLIQPYPSDWKKMEEILDQAKAMEKEQIIDAFLDGQDNGWQFVGSNEAQADSYYNQTYNADTP